MRALGSPPVAMAAPASAAVQSQAQAQATEFETLLVSRLTAALTSAAGLDGSGSGAEGETSSGPGAQLLGALVPQALTSALMAGGGTGLAASLVPALEGRTS